MEVHVDKVEPELTAILQRQRDASRQEAFPSCETRLDRLDRAIALLVDNRSRIIDAVTEDFGRRSPDLTAFAEVAGVIEPLKHAKAHLARWMAPEYRTVNPPLEQYGASARIEFQPLGVIGVVAPWNAPLRLVFHPLADILAAGNRAMVKPSELTPTVSALLAEQVPKYFDDTEVAIVTGGPDIAAKFVSLPFDHLIYTGSTAVGRIVMRAAAENLVPVTLELGGKCPVIIGRDADVDLTADRIMYGKTANAGQACIAPDYVYVHEDDLDSYVEAFVRSVGKQYPTLRDNPDYTAIINRRHYQRLRGYVEEARMKGAAIVEINPAAEDLPYDTDRIMAPTLIIRPSDDLRVMQEEIFGPLLPIRTYQDLTTVVEEINGRPRPLALYYFGRTAEDQTFVLSNTTSGNAVLNDVVMHTTQDDLPFGGVGASGFGAYRGIDGFRRFSHAKGIFIQSEQDVVGIAGLRSPYDARIRALLDFQIQR